MKKRLRKKERKARMEGCSSVYREYCEWYHKDLEEWRVEHLDPLVAELARMAKDTPQYDWQDLYCLERQKLICMEAYLSHYVAETDDFSGGRLKWLRLCIKLLEHIKEDGFHITDEQVRQMNIRNVAGLVEQRDLESFNEEEYEYDESGWSSKVFDGQKIYVRKMERLYHEIRMHWTRFWWH